MKLALRIEVATLRGVREGAPRLARLLAEHGAGGTFLFNVGPDRTGRAWDRLPRVDRLACYGAGALLSGWLLPPVDLGTRCADDMRVIRDAGFEAGILAWDYADWLNRAGEADETWTRAAMERACERFDAIFGAAALTRGAPGWQMNRYAYRHTQRLGFRHCSDTRGSGPFIPVVNGEIAACPQLPTTLPALDELLAQGLDADAAVRQLLELTASPPDEGHVCTLRAEIEGAAHEAVLRRLLSGWRELGCRVVSLGDYAAALDLAHLPRRVVLEQMVPGAPRPVATHGHEFLAQP